MKKICSIFLSLLVILSCLLFCSACGKPSMDDVFIGKIESRNANYDNYYDDIENIKFSELASLQDNLENGWVSIYAKRNVDIHGIYILDTDTDELEYTHDYDGTYTVGELILGYDVSLVVTEIYYDLI